MKLTNYRQVALLGAMLFAAACSKSGKGGAGSPDDYAGEGNIPLAQQGDELKDVHFAFDSSALSSQSKSLLSENARWLNDNPNQQVIIEGHCDERGTIEYNLALGDRRANSVRDYMRSLGITPTRMTTRSYGEELPLDPASNEAAWAKNRRAHFAIK